MSNKIKVGMVQINNSFDNQHYLPLSLGFLHSYAQENAKNIEDFEFLTPIHKRTSVDEAVKHLEGADIVAFSTYVWNYRISSEIAKRLKEKKPETIIVFGGCHVPEPNILVDAYVKGKNERYEEYIEKGGISNLEKMCLEKGSSSVTAFSYYDEQRDKGLKSFLEQNRFVDIASTGEGEIIFSSLLEKFPNREWGGVPGIHYLDEKGNLRSSFPPTKIENLNDVPSPYLNGYFNELMATNTDGKWIALFETNRGCPFACRFCDWGIGAKNRMSEYDLESRIFKEIDWISDNGIEFVYCCDANFGMYKARDMAIAERFASNKKEKGFPHRFSVQNTKNSTEASYEIQRVLNDSGLDKGVLLAFQSLHEPTLKAIDRGNIKLSNYHELQRRFTQEGIATFSDIILGLPLETYKTFAEGVSTLIENGQHNRIQFNNLSILPNAPMVEDIKKYGIELVESDMINIHGSLGEWADNIYERQQLVVGTNTMPKEDWVRARNFGYMTAFLHFDKATQVPNILLNRQYGIGYNEIIDTFIENPLKGKTLEEVSSLFSDHARNLQRGGAEYIHSKDWLDIWWPVDEYALIKLATEEKLDEFYKEAEATMSYILQKKGHSGYEEILSDSIRLNKELLKMPFNEEDKIVEVNHNLDEIYREGLIGNKPEIRKEKNLYIVDRKKDKWDSWEDWSRRVVWWGNKKGDYIYSYAPYTGEVK